MSQAQASTGFGGYGAKSSTPASMQPSTQGGYGSRDTGYSGKFGAGAQQQGRPGQTGRGDNSRPGAATGMIGTFGAPPRDPPPPRSTPALGGAAARGQPQSSFGNTSAKTYSGPSYGGGASNTGYGGYQNRNQTGAAATGAMGGSAGYGQSQGSTFGGGRGGYGAQAQTGSQGSRFGAGAGAAAGAGAMGGRGTASAGRPPYGQQSQASTGYGGYQKSTPAMPPTGPGVAGMNARNTPFGKGQSYGQQGGGAPAAQQQQQLLQQKKQQELMKQREQQRVAMSKTQQEVRLTTYACKPTLTCAYVACGCGPQVLEQPTPGGPFPTQWSVQTYIRFSRNFWVISQQEPNCAGKQE